MWNKAWPLIILKQKNLRTVLTYKYFKVMNTSITNPPIMYTLNTEFFFLLFFFLFFVFFFFFLLFLLLFLFLFPVSSFLFFYASYLFNFSLSVYFSPNLNIYFSPTLTVVYLTDHFQLHFNILAYCRKWVSDVCFTKRTQL